MRKILFVTLIAIPGLASAAEVGQDDFTTGLYSSNGQGDYSQNGSMAGNRRGERGSFTDLGSPALSGGTVGVTSAAGFAITANAGRSTEFSQRVEYRGTPANYYLYDSIRLDFSGNTFSPVQLQIDRIQTNLGPAGAWSVATKTVPTSTGAFSIYIPKQAFTGVGAGYIPATWGDMAETWFTFTGSGVSGGSLVLRNISYANNPVPEPASFVALGLGGLAIAKRRKRN